MSIDISQLLDQWEYQPGKLAVRKFRAKDGTEKIQLRLDLGVLQMNVEGRPDGKRPFGRATLLDHFEAQRDKHRKAHGGSDAGFQLSSEDCAKLQQEAVQFHHRYICLFQLEDYAGVHRDTDRNLAALEFLAHHAAAEDQSWTLKQFLPQLLMMRTRAKGALALQTNHYAEAITHIEEGSEAIRQFYREHERQEWLEQSGELHSLEVWLEEVKSRRPLSEREKLESALQQAVAQEDFEKAARVRDALRNLK